MPIRTAMNRPALAVLGTPAFCYVTAEALPVGLFPQTAHGRWLLLGARADGMTGKQAQP